MEGLKGGRTEGWKGVPKFWVPTLTSGMLEIQELLSHLSCLTH
uniref:Uncharacterized protein n=1 Tax=Anguilla anguilla TaxID=7936 RepID=A0A0E9UVP4_ANGAN